MAFVRDWQEEIRSMDSQDISDAAEALETLLNWQFFCREFKGLRDVHTLLAEEMAVRVKHAYPRCIKRNV